MAEAFRPLVEHKGLGFTLELPPEDVLVRGDANTLKLALRNLLENTLKFTPEGCVTLELWTEGDAAHLTVKDTGAGIPTVALPHLFERFYQADVRHQQQGSGLGLALVQSIVNWHGGKVTASNRTGGGACAGFNLPLGRSPALT